MAKETNDIANLASEYINNTDRHLFLTGKAGTGKTTFLTDIRNQTFKNAIVAAPTGIAAISAGGVTLHSLFHLPFGAFVPSNAVQDANINTPQSVLSKLQMNRSKRKLIRELELLIIDEVSMLRADLLDCIDLIIRSVRRRKNLPFGGVQLLLIGDLHQLPPVVKSHEWELLSAYYASMFFFDALALKQNPPVFLELEKIYRQSDQQFIEVLNRLRNSKLTSQDAEMLNGYYQPGFEPSENDGFVHLTTHNRKAEVVNKDKLKRINGKSHFFGAEITGVFPNNMYPALEQLELKEGAQVMFIKNDIGEDKRFYNGKIGRVKSFQENGILIDCGSDEDEIILNPMIWENIKYTLDKELGEIDEKVMGTFIQFPLQLAWSITVHKSQGLTFDKAILDLSDVFAPGQMYVALSRLRSLDGLVLSTPINPSVFKQDDAIIDFNNQKASFESLKSSISDESKKYINGYVTNVFNMELMLRELQWHKGRFTKGKNRSEKQKYLEWTNELIGKAVALKSVADKFNLQVNNMFLERKEDYLMHLKNRLEKAVAYFVPLLYELDKMVKKHLNLLTGRKRNKGYIAEVKELEALLVIKILALQKVQLLVGEMAENRQLTRNKLETLYAPLKKEVKKTTPKKDKIPSRKISYDGYKAGKTIKDIAKERGLVEGTIESHLCAYVATGKLQVVDFLDTYKLNIILELVNTLKSVHAPALKEKLGDEFTYRDIKFGLAHLKSLE